MRTSRDKFDFAVMSDLYMSCYQFKKNNPSIGIKIGLHNTSDDFGSKKPTDQFFGWFHCL